MCVANRVQIATVPRPVDIILLRPRLQNITTFAEVILDWPPNKRSAFMISRRRALRNLSCRFSRIRANILRMARWTMPHLESSWCECNTPNPNHTKPNETKQNQTKPNPTPLSHQGDTSCCHVIHAWLYLVCVWFWGCLSQPAGPAEHTPRQYRYGYRRNPA